MKFLNLKNSGNEINVKAEFVLIAIGLYFGPEIILEGLNNFQASLVNNQELISTIPDGILPEIFINPNSTTFIGKFSSKVFFLKKSNHVQ